MEKQEEKELQFPPVAMAEIMAKVTTSSQEGAKELRRRGCHVTIFPDQCLPGYLTSPIRVGIIELNSTEELRAYRASGGSQPVQEDDGDPGDDATITVSQQALACAFGRESISTVNGARLTREEKRVLWEVIGMAGRIVIGTAYMLHCTGVDGGGFTEKSMKTVEIF